MKVNCQKEYSDYQIKYFITDESMLEKYERFLMNLEIINDKDRVWCPYPDCDIAVSVKDANKNVE
jgi:hypothetical protein